MGEKSNQITREIENSRAALGSNLEELEGKVKGATDWRQQFDKHPFTMMGAALGGGILLANALGRRPSGVPTWCSRRGTATPVRAGK